MVGRFTQSISTPCWFREGLEIVWANAMKYFANCLVAFECHARYVCIGHFEGGNYRQRALPNQERMTVSICLLFLHRAFQNTLRQVHHM